MRKQFVTGAIAILALGSIAIPAVVDARGVHVRTVRLQDRCDPASFNAAIGEGTCIRTGNQRTVTFDEFLAKLNPVDFGHPKWNNHPDELRLRTGDQIKAVVRGGEFHTFTEVPEFGPGCVPLINDALGLTVDPPTPEECDEFFATTGVAPNGLSTLIVADLAPGTHKFMCEIHPWMKTVVTVEGDDGD